MGNIILIGFMGVGKSEVGRRLAAELSMNYIDTDSLVEETEGKTISQIFKEKGEPYFRALETKVIETLLDYDNFVISAGGGIVLKRENVEMLKKIGPLVLLTAREEVISERLKGVKDRPLLDVGDPDAKIKEILTQRIPIYESVADFKVDTSDISSNEAAERIIEFVKGPSST